MEQYKIDFIELLVKAEALKFGEFTLKSGRVAPYFLNAGSFYTGELVTKLAESYAGAFEASGLSADTIFGPAYKGIPLAVATVSALHNKYGKNVKYCFNRKEAKDHGMKGVFVGAPIEADTRLVLIDDVITAGTAIRETMALLKEHGDPKVEGVLISMDRMEKNNDGVSAIASIEEEFGFKVYPIVTLDDVIEALYNKEVDGKVYIDDAMMETIKAYRAVYGV